MPLVHFDRPTVLEFFNIPLEEAEEAVKQIDYKDPIDVHDEFSGDDVKAVAMTYAHRKYPTANDKDKVASMTRFPFKTKGQTDSDPVKTHTKGSFLKIWDKILQADPGLRPETDTMRRYVERKATITSKDLGSGKGSARIGTFVFEKVQGKWLFTMAYLDE